MDKVTFDGINKIIDILPGVDSVNVEADIYSAWKEWLLIGDNAKYPQALRTSGGEPLVGGKVSPKYFFLMNGWLLRTQLGSGVTYVETNLFRDDGGNPFISGGARDSIISNTNDGTVVVVSGEGGGVAPTPAQNAQAVWDYLSDSGTMKSEVEEIKKRVKENQGLIVAGL